MKQEKIQHKYGVVRSPQELGLIARGHRKQKKLTIETLAGLAHLSTRFVSEFERGKETAELGKVMQALNLMGLEIIVQPRHYKTGVTPSSSMGS